MSPQRASLGSSLGISVFRALVTGLTVAAVSLTTLAAQQSPARTDTNASARKILLGFTASGSEKQRALEAQMDGLVSADNLRTWMKRLAARPHHVGSPYDKDNAEFIAGLFKSWGYDTTIES